MTIPDKGTLCTGDTLSPVLVKYQFYAPDELWVNQALYGLLWDYAQVNAWTACGAVSVASTVEAFVHIWESLMKVPDTGTIILFAGLAAPANTLPCDGGSYLKTDYPNLYAAVGVIWGSADAFHFNVPDLRGRAPVGAGTGSGLSPRTLADVGGEEQHLLSGGEVPAHVHTESAAAPNATTIGPGAPQPTAVPAPGVTGSAGGGGSHNNMQPFGVVNYAIVI